MNEFGIVEGTPIEVYQRSDGSGHVHVKREDLSAPAPGPAFAKYRGVVEHIRNRNESVIGVLDTFHSKAGWAVAYACSILGRTCVNYYPKYKGDGGELRPQQIRAKDLGATLSPLRAGRSAVLYHGAKKDLTAGSGYQPAESAYMMPNALKLPESIEANAAEAARTDTSRYGSIVLSASSGTIAAGVIKGVLSKGENPEFIIHMGYSRSREKLFRYIALHGWGVDYPGFAMPEEVKACRIHNPAVRLRFVDEGYAYKDQARGEAAPFPCNPYYDLKAWNWLMAHPEVPGPVLFWNIGA